MNELKPCPFCGENPYYEENFTCYDEHLICCSNKQCGIVMFDKTKNKVIKKWNKRYIFIEEKTSRD